MRSKRPTETGFRKIIKAVVGHLPAALSSISLIVAIAAFYNTTKEQDREDARKEMLIAPVLSYVFANNNNNDLSISVENKGLGPAVVRDVIIQIDRECFDSASYVSFPDWEATYNERIIPAFEKLLRSSIDSGALALLSAPDQQNQTISKQGETTSPTVESGTTIVTSKLTLHSSTLGPGQIIEAGGTLLAFKSTIEKDVREHSDSKVAAIGTMPRATPADDLPLADLDVGIGNAFQKVHIGVGYCSFSGQTCNVTMSSDSKCFRRFS
jgi:hypothetical protein